MNEMLKGIIFFFLRNDKLFKLRSFFTSIKLALLPEISKGKKHDPSKFVAN